MDLTKLEIHSMTISDLDEIKDELLDKFDNFWNYQIFKEELANTNSKYLVARFNNQIVAFGGIKLILDEADIMDIVTRKDMRQNGFAKLLLHELITLSIELGCNTITLEVNSNNTPAINLYESFNFKRVGLRKKYYNNTDDAILMTLQLV